MFIYSTCYRYCASTTSTFIYHTYYSYCVFTKPTVYLQHPLQILCIRNTYIVSIAPVTDIVYPEHLQSIYSTYYSNCVFTKPNVYLHRYCASTTPAVYLQHLLQLLSIHNIHRVYTAPVTPVVYL